MRSACTATLGGTLLHFFPPLSVLLRNHLQYKLSKLKKYSGTESSWHRTAHIRTIKLSAVPKAGSAMQTTSTALAGSEHRPKLYVPAPEPSPGVIWERAAWLGCSQYSAWDSSSG